MRVAVLVCGMGLALGLPLDRPALAQQAASDAGAGLATDGMGLSRSRRAAVDQAFAGPVLDYIDEALANRTGTQETEADRSARYAALMAETGLYGALNALWAEQGLDLREPLSEPAFYALAEAFLLARDRGDYTGDDLEYLPEDMSGILQLLSQGKDIPTMYRGLIQPILAETAHLHPALARIAASEEELRKAEADRQAAEADAAAAVADRQAAEARARAAEETARAIRKLLGVPSIAPSE